MEPGQAVPVVGVEFRRQLGRLVNEAEGDVELPRQVVEGGGERRVAVGAGPARHAGGEGFGHGPDRIRTYRVLRKGGESRDW